MRFDNTHSKPIGVIHNGPIHTIHHPDGSLAADTFWYEISYRGDQDVFKPKNGWEQLEKNRRWTTSHIRRLAYCQDLENIIVRYVTALDHSDMDVAFLQVWSILEKITDTVGGRYDDTIRRAIRIFSDRTIAKETLESLRLRRNQLVHAARSGENSEQIVYAIKQVVDPHLRILIRNEYGVHSLEEYGEYLDLSTDIEFLKRQRRHLNTALRQPKKVH